jgi:hypothetical protein
MDTRRARILFTSLVSLVGVMAASASPVAAACALSAPASVNIGAPLAINGSGYPASTAVDVSITVDGGAPDEFTVQSDANGTFQISLTPEASDAGLTTVVATTGAACTAQAVIGVGVPAPTEAPGPAEPEAVAPPRTDALAAVPASTSAARGLPWLMAVALFVLGVVGLYATRPARSR